MRIAVASVLAVASSAEAPGKHYKPHDPVFIVANKVGPFNNPSETYEVRGKLTMDNIYRCLGRCLHGLATSLPHPFHSRVLCRLIE